MHFKPVKPHMGREPNFDRLSAVGQVENAQDYGCKIPARSTGQK
jgi:hypothetical protein